MKKLQVFQPVVFVYTIYGIVSKELRTGLATLKANMVKQKLPTNNGGFTAIGFGKTDSKMYSQLTTDHLIDLCRYKVANRYTGL